MSNPLRKGVIAKEAKDGLVVRNGIAHNRHIGGVVGHLGGNALLVVPEVVAQHVVLLSLRVDQARVELGRVARQFPVVLNGQADEEVVALGVAQDHVGDCGAGRFVRFDKDYGRGATLLRAVSGNGRLKLVGEEGLVDLGLDGAAFNASCTANSRLQCVGRDAGKARLLEKEERISRCDFRSE